MSYPLNDRLLTAAELGDALTITKLVKRSILLDVNVRDQPFGETALAKAVRGGHAETVIVLLEAKADVNIYNASYVSPLHLAATGNHIEILKRLIIAGADTSLRCRSGMRAIDLCPYDSEVWKILNRAAAGKMPTITVKSEVPIIPAFSIPKPAPEDDSKKNNKKGKKGKTGKKKTVKKKRK